MRPLLVPVSETRVKVAEAEENEPLTAEVSAVPLLLQPNPAYIIGGNYDVLSHNQAADE